MPYTTREDSKFAKYALPIGWVCMQWTALEVEINGLLLALIPMEQGHAGQSLMAQIDMREKVQIAKTLGFIKKPDDKWFKELQELLNYIDNELRIKRNRYVHDLWFFEEEKMKKMQFVNAIKRPQSWKPLELLTHSETEVQPSEIWKTADQILDATLKLNSISLLFALRLASRKI